MKSPLAIVGLIFVVLGMLATAAGHWIGLFVAPPEAMMGDVGRILYVHVPTAWAALIFFMVAFVAAIGSLWSGWRGFDAATTGAVEVGTVLTFLLLIQGSIWARPTWNTWWTWDPRLTTSAVLAAAFGVVLLMRRLIDQPAKRQMATAVATIIAFVDVPVVYFSVKWWASLHQQASTRASMDSVMGLPLGVAALGMLVMGTGLMLLRTKVELVRLAHEADAPELPPTAAPLRLDDPAGGDPTLDEAT
ncbi:MAG: cytochrome c biogenesis protein CcsA [Alphaproteobacteria bacterium]|nr:cytochrome c biogenesis protein CcsA [Alphaproteobacteria bacterium]